MRELRLWHSAIRLMVKRRVAQARHADICLPQRCGQRPLLPGMHQFCATAAVLAAHDSIRVFESILDDPVYVWCHLCLAFSSRTGGGGSMVCRVCTSEGRHDSAGLCHSDAVFRICSD